MAWNKKATKNVLIDTKERETIITNRKGKVKSRVFITEAFSNDGKQLDQRTTLMQNEKPKKLIKFFSKISILRNWRWIEVVDEGNRLIIQDGKGKVISDEKV